MSTTQNPLFACSTCQAPFELEEQYKQHYKSEYHRYNLKRKMINLPPTTYTQYIEQFEGLQSKTSSAADFRCEICSKGFLSSNTYTHHLNSKKHKQARDKMLNRSSDKAMRKSGSQNSSNFSIISHQDKRTDKCFFCPSNLSEDHLKMHNFPPFRYNCADYTGMVDYVQKVIESFRCLYCSSRFSSVQAVKQHMMQVGHTRVNTDQFQEFEQFYDWTIREEQNEDDQEEDWEPVQESKTPESRPTLKDLQAKRKQRITMTKTGAKVNGKLVGLRAYRKYYNQYFRPIQKIDRTPKAIRCEQELRDFAPMKYKVPSIVVMVHQ